MGASDAAEPFGAGRSCLVVSAGGAPDVAAALSRAGFAPAVVEGEHDALAALEGGGFAAVYVEQALGSAAVSTLAAAAGQRLGGAPVTVLGRSGTVQEAVDAMQLGADDYLPPPFPAGELLRRLARALERPGAARAAAPGRLLGLDGSSPAVRRLHAAIEKISRYKSNVLLLGESGTGKEIVAHALHDRGPRRQHLFVPVNCATLGRDILENELFGHERGAFTGANERKRGLFELADGGTFFLDEIAEMDLSTQAKLLRVLERNEFRRVGGTGKVKVDLSIVAATNRDLEQAIAAGRFRHDLYYRLKVVTLVVPPLRERREDIPALVHAFIADFNRRSGGQIAGIAPAAIQRLVEQDWPGNVRELRNAVEGACVLATGEVVKLEDLELAGRPAGEVAAPRRRAPGPRRAAGAPAAAATPGAAMALAPGATGGAVVEVSLDGTLAEAERRIVLAALRRHGTRARTARALGIGLRTLYTRLAAWGVDPEDAGSA
ncbi:sigma-54 dependent transcriptional regulator [Anaeromyxobacter sp. PSR-1]|uniref:sigma-54-dependent transcriptional regulator n=1 Tax=unclassified Anaeromyxobacter TaxID=2620896 RepID=UPI0005DD0BA9|nr:sigma-54 dependent transcriptional regulator [Anaeromyxobacter sp. PSR-1]GAO05378.1 acetoacetate metabolism regulatory protein AtoC [Anaeromyxobacter sp. PSR-1]